MGLCSSNLVDQDLKDLQDEREKDLQDTQPVFDALNIGHHKKLQNAFLEMYESVCQGGRGSLKSFRKEYRLNTSKQTEFFFTRNIQFFDPMSSGFHFTCPQFVLFVYNLLTLHGREMPPEWGYRCWFGGDSFDRDIEAPRKEVWEMEDAAVSFLICSTLYNSCNCTCDQQQLTFSILFIFSLSTAWLQF